MTRLFTSLSLIALSGMFGLALSSGHALFRADAGWSGFNPPVVSASATPGADGTMRGGAILLAAPVTKAVSSARTTDTPTTDTPAVQPDTRVSVAARASSGPLASSPRPRARADALAFAVARSVALSPDTRLSAVSDPVFDGGVAGDPSRVALASVMSKAPSVGAPVPSYLHGVYR